MTDKTLAGIFGFTDEDLDYNQAGEVSPRQLFQLKTQNPQTLYIAYQNWLRPSFQIPQKPSQTDELDWKRSFIYQFAPFLLVIRVIVWIILQFAPFWIFIAVCIGVSLSFQYLPPAVNWCVLGGSLLAGGWLMWNFNKGMDATALDAKNPLVNTIVGKPYLLTPSRANRKTYYSLKVEGWQLYLTQGQYAGFEKITQDRPEQEFAFFFLPHSKRILSVCEVSLDPEDFFVEA